MTVLATVAIIGGGIGGLNLARALSHRNPNLKITVYEQIKDPQRQQGWHLGINEQGYKAMKEAQIDELDEITGRSSPTAFIVTDQHLNELLRFGGPKATEKVGLLTVIHRNTLHRLLAKGVNIVYGKRFVRYEEHDDRVDVFFEDDTQISADFVVGADGCWSLFRKQLSPSIRYEPVAVSQFGVIMPAPDPSEIPTLMRSLSFAMLRSGSPTGYSLLTGVAENETGGRDMFIGMSWPDKIIEGKLPESNEDMLEWMRQVVRTHFHPEFSYAMANIDVSNVLLGGTRQVHTTNYQEHCPLANVKHQRVTLLGDAAHAMTTNKGMGANTALMDSIDLANALADDDWQHALTKYERTMWTRASFEVKDSLKNTWRNHNVGTVSFAFGKFFMQSLNLIIRLAGQNNY